MQPRNPIRPISPTRRGNSLKPTLPYGVARPASPVVRAALGDLDDLRETVDCLEAYQAFQPDHDDRRHINRHLPS